MSREDFYQEVLEGVKTKVNDNYTVSLKSILKNNGNSLTGIIITEQGVNISPTIYLDDMYENISVKEAVNEVLSIYADNKTPSIDFKWFFDYDNLRDKVIPQLINYEMNKELLADVPYIKWLDLAIIFKIIISSDSDGIASITVHNEHLKMWDILIDDILEDSKRNVRLLFPSKLTSIDKTLSELGVDFGEGLPLYILTNNSQQNGAYYMSCIDIIDRFANEHGTNVIILPSSIHEIILLEDSNIEPEYLKDLVSEVNRCELLETDVLSYNVYRYDLNSKSMSII